MIRGSTLTITSCAAAGLLAVCVGGTFAAPAPKSVVKRSTTKPPSTSSAALVPYLNRLRSKLTNNWLIPDGKNSVTISATVHGDGSCENIQVSSVPKNDQAEASCSDAFSKSQPLEALPSGVNEGKLTLNFTSSADPHGDSSSNITTRLDPIAPPKAASDAAKASGAPNAK